MAAGQTLKPVRMPAQERREQLLDVTKSIVERHGLHALSIQALARQARVSPPLRYGHFPGPPRLRPRPRVAGPRADGPYALVVRRRGRPARAHRPRALSRRTDPRAHPLDPWATRVGLDAHT